MSAPILARIGRSARLAGQAMRTLVGGAGVATTASASDFQGGGFFASRRMSPAEVRMVLERATNGELQAQWDLFALMEDTWPRLAKNLAELRRAASRATYAVQPYAEKGAVPSARAKEKSALVDRGMRQWWPKPGTLELSFEDTLFHGLDAYGKGLSVLEVHWHMTRAGMLPRASHVLAAKRYGWNADGTELGLLTAEGTGWRPFDADHFLVGIWQARTGAPGPTAVLRPLAPYWAGVTFGWEWLLSNAQIFGVPFRWANFDRNSPGLGAQLRDMLRDMGATGYAAFPEGTKLEFKEASGNVTGNPQVVVQEMADKACDLLILGQELSGGAQAAGLGGGAAGLQQSVRADRLLAAAQWCADLLNYQLVPGILRANYGDTEEPPTIVPDLDADPDPLQMAQRDQVFLSAGVALPRSWFYQRHGIPEPVEGEAVITGRAPSVPMPGNDPAAALPPIAAKYRAPAVGLSDEFRKNSLAALATAERSVRQPLLARLAALREAATPEAYAAELRRLSDDLPAIGTRTNSDLAKALEQILAPAAVTGVAAASTLSA